MNGSNGYVDISTNFVHKHLWSLIIPSVQDRSSLSVDEYACCAEAISILTIAFSSTGPLPLLMVSGNTIQFACDSTTD